MLLKCVLCSVCLGARDWDLFVENENFRILQFVFFFLFNIDRELLIENDALLKNKWKMRRTIRDKKKTMFALHHSMVAVKWLL